MERQCMPDSLKLTKSRCRQSDMFWHQTYRISSNKRCSNIHLTIIVYEEKIVGDGVFWLTRVKWEKRLKVRLETHKLILERLKSGHVLSWNRKCQYIRKTHVSTFIRIISAKEFYVSRLQISRRKSEVLFFVINARFLHHGDLKVEKELKIKKKPKN